MIEAVLVVLGNTLPQVCRVARVARQPTALQ